MQAGVILVGLMGAGKSSVGRRLADHWSCPFIDMDHSLTSIAGMSIPELFLRYGEVFFRDREEQLLGSLLENWEPGVLSTGGGAVLRAASRYRMREAGKVIYLHAPPATLVERLQRTDVRQRPVLGEKEKLASRVKQLYNERDALYREVAHYVVETEALALKQLVQRVTEWSG
jgi:shikimate kinase